MMRRIELSDGRIFACNQRGRGVFFRRSHEGAYRQLAGTCQTPTFRTPAQFRTYLREHHGVYGARIVDTAGWDRDE